METEDDINNSLYLINIVQTVFLFKIKYKIVL